MSRFNSILVAALSLFMAGTAHAHEARNIIRAVVSAPVVGNGLVAGEPMEINIFFAGDDGGSSDAVFAPDEKGLQIPAGGWMELEFNGDVLRNRNSDGSPAVYPLAANANVILTTGPQNPIVAGAGDGVQHGNWQLEDDGNRLLIIRPLGGHGANGLEGARAKKLGFKVAHVRPNPRSGVGPAVFVNGTAGGVATVSARIYNDHGELIASGYHDIVLQGSVGRQVHITNAGLTTGGQGSPATTTASLVELVDYQTVAPGAALTQVDKVVPFATGAPYAPRFVFFEEAAAQPDPYVPMLGLDNVDYVVDATRPWLATLSQHGSDIVGTIILTSPNVTDRGAILPSVGPTTIGGNGSVFSVPVQIGESEGVYKVRIQLQGGGSATTTILAED